MARHNRFARGMFGRQATVFPCRVCERKTRDTGDGDICKQCFELAGIENEISDGNATASERHDMVRRYLAQLQRKGVDVTVVWSDIIATCGITL